MTRLPYLLAFLTVFLVGCTDLSKVEKEEKNPIEPVPPEPAEATVSVITVSFPFQRVIKDQSGRSIDATILAKFDSRIGFEKRNGMQKFILPLERLSDEDQTFFEGIYDGGDSQAVLNAISKTARLGNREASWNRDLEAAKREADKLDLPRLTVFLEVGDPVSKTFGNDLMFSRAFRKWAGQNLVLLSIPVEPQDTKMAITDVMAENRRVAELYKVHGSVAAALDIPGKPSFYRVPLDDVSTVEDLIREVEKVLKKRMK